MITSQPAAVAILAAISFDTMPPRPTPEMDVPAIASISMADGGDFGNMRGGRIARRIGGIKPSTSDSSTRQFGFHHGCDARRQRSLSPKRISAVATVSFSLMTATLPSDSSVFNVARAFK